MKEDILMQQVNKMSIIEKLRVGHVKRWQIVRVAREQTIGEHMYRVYLICSEICARIDIPDDIKLKIIHWALIHDLPEVVTGDLATPIKSAMRNAVPESDPIKRIELELDADYNELYKTIKSENDQIVIKIVKLADLMEAAYFLSVEGMGKHAKKCRDDLLEKIRDIYITLVIEFRSINWEPVAALIDEICEE